MEHLFYSTVKPSMGKKSVWYQIMSTDFIKRINDQTPNQVPWDSPPDYFNNFGGDLKGIQEKIPYLKNLFGSLENIAFYLNPISFIPLQIINTGPKILKKSILNSALKMI